MAGKRQPQVAKRLVGHTGICIGHHFLGSQVLCFHVFSGKEQFPHLGDILEGLGVGVAVRPACPDGLLVQLYLLDSRVPVYHGSNLTVTQGKRLCPSRRGLIIPQFE